MEESGLAVLDQPSPPLLSHSLQQCKRKQGELHKEANNCSLAAVVMESVQFLPFYEHHMLYLM